MTIGQAMIFCQTRKTASWLVEKMTKDGHAVALLSGNFKFFKRSGHTRALLHFTKVAAAAALLPVF